MGRMGKSFSSHVKDEKSIAEYLSSQFKEARSENSSEGSFENPYDNLDTSQDKYLSSQFKDERSEVGLAHAACLWEKCVGPDEGETVPVVCKKGKPCKEVMP